MTALRIHGGRIDIAAALYPDAPRPWLDLSTGVNPCAWPTDNVAKVDVHNLPSPNDLEALEAAAAAAFAIDPDSVVAVPGSEIGLRLLSSLGLPQPVRCVVPSYATHSEAFPGTTPIDRSAIDAVEDGTLLLANPNNPDGLLDRPERLATIARKGVQLVIDEAFADVAPECSVIPLLSSDQSVIVFRSFGKFFGLPGIRLGFMIAAPDHVAKMRQRLGSWPISAHAIAYGTAAYQDANWIADARKSIVERASALDVLLARYGLNARGECPLFRLVETDDASAVFERLARAGILTRTFDHSPRWLRMGVPAGNAGFERLDKALAYG